jgi:D-3-phosphoglycerate dehydrogenase / 2-oxoglutarate reductase
MIKHAREGSPEEVEMKILVSDNLAACGVDKLKRISEFQVDVKSGLSHQELCEIIKEYDGLIIRSATKVTEEVIACGEKLKVVARAGIGLDNVDIEAASRRGIVVMNAPEGNVITTAEHAIAMLLALTRNIPQAVNSLKSGKWEKSRFRGREVSDKVLGVIGVGRIGRVVAERAKGLKMKVIAFDPYINSEVVDKLGIQGVTLNELFAQSDYITVHTPLTKETRNLLNADAFSKMKKGIFIINCARGGIINEPELAEAIRAGIVAGAALDVFAEEPPKDNPLLELDQVIATPHLGASTDEAQENVAMAVAEQVAAFLQRGTIRNAVNAPSIDGATLAVLRPYLTLAERLGSLLAQITRGAIQEVNIVYIGETTSVDTKPLTFSILKGLLNQILGDMVNFVNVPMVAKERNIKVTASSRDEAEDFTNLITVQLRTSEDTNLVAGTIFGKKDPRLVRINDFRLEAAMEGNSLLIYNIDTPGTIGAIGTCLGRHHINISMMDVGQVLERGENIIFLRTDTPVTQQVTEALLSLDNVNVVQSIKF